MRDRSLALAAAVALGLGGIYVVSLLPVVRGGSGYSAFLDVWLNFAADAAVIVVVALRGWIDRRMRAAWWCLAAGLIAAFLGSVLYYADYRYRDPIPFPSLTDLGFVGFYVLAYAAIVLMLRDRLRPFPASMWLDGLIAAFTTAAFAAAFALEPALEATGGRFAAVATTLAYPVADLILVMFLAAAFVVLGTRGGRAWGWLAVGLLIFFVTDSLYVNAAASGTYETGDPIDIGWAAARLCFVMSAIQPLRRDVVVRTTGRWQLLAPTAGAVGAIALLFLGTRIDLPVAATTLALLGLVAAVARTVLAFGELINVAETRRQATTDELTGLPNRRAFLRALRAPPAPGREGSTAVLLVDLDRFKEVNDSLGHAAGDDLLRLVSERLASVLRPRDLFARLGGDEFAVLAPVADAEEAAAIGVRLRGALTRPFALGAAELDVDASVGIALTPEHASGADELLQAADLAMYAAKERGGGALVFDEERDGAGRHRLDVVAQLRAAIPAGQLFLQFQPQLSLRTGRIVGAEALVRWRHPDRGVLGPQEFVDLAESSGAMRSLTTAVLDLALDQARQWRDHGLDLDVAVNISPSDLVDRTFPDRVERGLAERSLSPSTLVIEITEGHVMEDRKAATGALERLRALGVGVAVDDFGTGYSSLAYLAELPVTELKLDRTFVQPMLVRPRARSVVRSTVQLAHELELEVVAEGVEDEATLEALVEIGCTHAQGFHISRPTTAEEVAAAAKVRASRARRP